MTYKIFFKPSAVKQLSDLPKSIQKRLKVKIDGLANNPRPVGIKKLQGSQDLYRLRHGDYRVIYQIQDVRVTILVVKIGHRKDVYR